MPACTDFVLTPIEDQLVHQLTGADGIVEWTNEALADIKLRIKNLHKQLQSESCCYCRKGFHGEFDMVIDIEHVLPKSKFPQLTFSSLNLSLACKRCNMNVKRDRLDFLTTHPALDFDPSDRLSYKFIHPNLDQYDEHLSRISIEINNCRLLKYSTKPGSSKGEYTREFFRLHELEIDSFDEGQGMNIIPLTDQASEIRRILGM